MCGRYVVAYDPQTLVSGFSLTRIQPFEPSWNLAPIHDRMPVMLPAEHWQAWLDRGQQDPAALPALMQGLPDGAMQTWPVARRVGRASEAGPGLIEPLTED